MDRIDIMFIAGYDVLANAIPTHQNYVEACFGRAINEHSDLIFTVGGATNPDFPKLTEAEANEIILKELKKRFHETKTIPAPHVIPFPVGNTSAETLEVVKEFLEGQDIFVDKLTLCAEQSRLSGFMLDAQMVKLLDLPQRMIAYGHPFPDSKKDFASQRRKMPMKVLSHYGFPFNIIRRVYQWFHQKRVAWTKRKETKAPRS